MPGDRLDRYIIYRIEHVFRRPGGSGRFKGFGFHPLWAFIDHGQAGCGEPAAVLLRPDNAGSNTAADHITVASRALGQLPRRLRRSRSVLVRADSAGGTHAFLDWLHRRRLGFRHQWSAGKTIRQRQRPPTLRGGDDRPRRPRLHR